MRRVTPQLAVRAGATSLICWASVYYSTWVSLNNSLSTHSTQPASWTLERL